MRHPRDFKSTTSGRGTLYDLSTYLYDIPWYLVPGAVCDVMGWICPFCWFVLFYHAAFFLRVLLCLCLVGLALFLFVVFVRCLNVVSCCLRVLRACLLFLAVAIFSFRRKLSPMSSVHFIISHSIPLCIWPYSEYGVLFSFAKHCFISLARPCVFRFCGVLLFPPPASQGQADRVFYETLLKQKPER